MFESLLCVHCLSAGGVRTSVRLISEASKMVFGVLREKGGQELNVVLNGHLVAV